MMRKMPENAATKPRKNRGVNRSPLIRKWARRAVKNGTTATMIPTLEASVYVRAMFSSRKYRVTPVKPAPANRNSFSSRRKASSEVSGTRERHSR